MPRIIRLEKVLAALCVLPVVLGIWPAAVARVAAQPAPAPQLSLADVVRVTLERSPSILIDSEQVRYGEGALRAAGGVFDPQLNLSLSGLRDQTLYTVSQRELYEAERAETGFSTYRVGLSKQFRSGLVVSPGAEVTRTDAFTFDAAPVVRTRASLLVAVPLLRGRGLNLAAAGVDAAERSVEADRLALRHTTARSVYDAVAAYWNYVAAYQAQGILSETEERARRLLHETEALVEGGERPVADLDQLQANLADKIAARIGAGQTLFEAKQRLGLAMGLSPDQTALLPPPTEPFPEIEALPTLPPRAVLLGHAAQRRADLHASRVRQEAASVLARASRHDARPRFDLQIDLGYAGLSESRLRLGQYLPPVGQNDVSGATASVALVYNWAAGNNRARGEVARQEATYRQRRLVAEDLERRVSSGVAVAAEMLGSSAAEMAKAREAVRLYRKAVENEKKKLQLGMSTLFDVTLVEDRLTNALLGQVSAQGRAAQALALLRFETGTLIEAEGDLGAQIEALRTVPFQGQ